MRHKAIPTILLFAAFAFVALGAFGEEADERNVQQMIDELEMPAVGNVFLGVSFSTEILRDTSSPEEVGEETTAIEERIDADTATAADWARLAKLSEDRSQANAARQRAMELYEEQLQQQPEDAPALVGLGGLLLGVGRVAEAESLLNKALELDPGHLAAYSLMGSTLVFEATPFFRAWSRALLARYPDEMTAMGYSGDNLPPLHLPAEYQGFRARVAADFPALAAAFAAIMREPPTAEDIEQADAAAQRASEWLPKARAFLMERLQTAPTSETFDTYVNLEWSVSWASAMAKAARVIAEGGDADISPQAAAQWLLGPLTNPQLVEAGQRVCEAQPDNLRHRALVGSMQLVGILFGGMMEQAVEGGTPKFPTPTPEQLRPIVENLSAAMTLPADQRSGIAGALACLHMLEGNREACVKVADDAIGDGEWDYVAVSAALIATLGVSLQDLTESDMKMPVQEHPEVEPMLTRWLEQADPDEHAAYGTLGRIRSQLGDWTGTADALGRARELQPDSGTYAHGLGVAYLKGGQPEKAVAALVAAIKLQSDDEDEAKGRHNAYGVALLAVGRTQEAEVQLQWQP